jgi:hypothetical protein
LVLYILLFYTWSGNSQDYLNVYLDSIHFAETKIKRLPNGDIILATSSLESLRNGGKEARLFCQRINYCGQVMWSYAYKVPDDHIIMNDLAILNTNEIVLYGSIYKGLKESIFLMKINFLSKYFNQLLYAKVFLGLDFSEDPKLLPKLIFKGYYFI